MIKTICEKCGNEFEQNGKDSWGHKYIEKRNGWEP